MQEVTLHKVCTNCSGTGQVTSGAPGQQQTITCPWPGCGGTGYITLGKIELDPGLDDLMDKLNDVIDKCDDILEKFE